MSFFIFSGYFFEKYIYNGGAYVGFCAGTFIATKEIGSSGVTGLGIIPGVTRKHIRNAFKKVSAEPSWWMVNGEFKSRTVYWEGGPVIKLTSSEIKMVEVVGWYKRGGWAAALKTKYGKGRVAVSALHPEASQEWFDSAHVRDTDGVLDYSLATELVEWATAKH